MNNEQIDDSSLRDGWKGVKGLAAVVFAAKAAPFIAAAIGCPPLAVAGAAGFLGHFLCSLAARKWGIPWL